MATPKPERQVDGYPGEDTDGSAGSAARNSPAPPLLPPDDLVTDAAAAPILMSMSGSPRTAQSPPPAPPPPAAARSGLRDVTVVDRLAKAVTEFFGGVPDLELGAERGAGQRPWVGKVWCCPRYAGSGKVDELLAGEYVAAAISKYRKEEIKECLLLLPAAFTSPWFSACLLFPYGIARTTVRQGVTGEAARMADVLVYIGPRVREFVATFDPLLYIPGNSIWAYRP